jgi:hypothetical protein
MWMRERKCVVELYDVSALDREESKFVNKSEDLSGSSLVLNLNLDKTEE